MKVPGHSSTDAQVRRAGEVAAGLVRHGDGLASLTGTAIVGQGAVSRACQPRE
jgi:hypothetical protein